VLVSYAGGTPLGFLGKEAGSDRGDLVENINNIDDIVMEKRYREK